MAWMQSEQAALTSASSTRGYGPARAFVRRHLSPFLPPEGGRHKPAGEDDNFSPLQHASLEARARHVHPHGPVDADAIVVRRERRAGDGASDVLPQAVRDVAGPVEGRTSPKRRIGAYAAEESAQVIGPNEVGCTEQAASPWIDGQSYSPPPSLVASIAASPPAPTPPSRRGGRRGWGSSSVSHAPSLRSHVRVV